MTQTINIELPADILLTLNESEQELKKQIRTYFAVQLYLQDKVTIGKAAQIADMSRLEFETFLSQKNIAISRLDLEDVFGDAAKLD